MNVKSTLINAAQSDDFSADNRQNKIAEDQTVSQMSEISITDELQKKTVGDFMHEILAKEPVDARLRNERVKVFLEIKKPMAEMSVADYEQATWRAIFKEADCNLLTDAEIRQAVGAMRAAGYRDADGGFDLKNLRRTDAEPGQMTVTTDKLTIEMANRAGQAVLQYKQQQAKMPSASEQARNEVNQITLDQGRIVWNSAVNTVEGTINTALDAALTNGGTNPLPLLNPNRSQADFSSAKSDYQSQMMRRNLNGKLDGDGVKRGEATEIAVTILGPIVAGVASAPKPSPQSLKTLGGIPEVEAAAAVKTAQQISKLKVPQGMTETQFAEFSQIIRESKAAQYGTDIRVHGSRAMGTATKTSDIDIAIRVPKEKFDAIIKEAFTRAKPGNAAERTMNHAIKTGKIQRGEIKLSSLGDKLKSQFGFKVDISVIKQGGVFDQGPWIPLK